MSDIKKIQKSLEEIIIIDEKNLKNRWIEIIKNYDIDLKPIEAFVTFLIDRKVKTQNEQWWFEKVADEIKKINYGNIEFKLTIKHNKVVNIKSRIENNFNISK